MRPASHVRGDSPTLSSSLAVPGRLVSALTLAVSQGLFSLVGGEPSPLLLLELPQEILVRIFNHLDTFDLARLARTCSFLWGDCSHSKPVSPIELVLRRRMNTRRPLPTVPPESWVLHLLWREYVLSNALARGSSGRSPPQLGRRRLRREACTFASRSAFRLAVVRASAVGEATASAVHEEADREGTCPT